MKIVPKKDSAPNRSASRRLAALKKAVGPWSGGAVSTVHHPILQVKVRNHWGLWTVPALMLIAAVLPWPYGYYVFLRLVVCIVAGWLTAEHVRHEQAISGWAVSFGIIAILYNPVVPVHLTREIWTPLNLGTAAVFLLHIRFLQRKMKTLTCEADLSVSKKLFDNRE